MELWCLAECEAHFLHTFSFLSLWQFSNASADLGSMHHFLIEAFLQILSCLTQARLIGQFSPGEMNLFYVRGKSPLGWLECTYGGVRVLNWALRIISLWRELFVLGVSLIERENTLMEFPCCFCHCGFYRNALNNTMSLRNFLAILLVFIAGKACHGKSSECLCR